jgi:flagellar protein FliO/FliZ
MDTVNVLSYFAALLVVLALVGLAGLAARRYGVPGIVKSNATRRLSVVETLMVAPRYKLFLLRRDDIDHLVLLGPQGASVIESGVPVVAIAPAIVIAPTPDIAT